MHSELSASGGYIGGVGLSGLARDRLANLQGALGVQTLRQRLREDRGHVLHDEKRHAQIAREGRHQAGQGVRAAGGNPDEHDFGPAGRH